MPPLNQDSTHAQVIDAVVNHDDRIAKLEAAIASQPRILADPEGPRFQGRVPIADAGYAKLPEVPDAHLASPVGGSPVSYANTDKTPAAKATAPIAPDGSPNLSETEKAIVAEQNKKAAAAVDPAPKVGVGLTSDVAPKPSSTTSPASSSSNPYAPKPAAPAGPSSPAGSSGAPKTGPTIVTPSSITPG